MKKGIVLITGASSGFGLATAKKFAAAGYRVFGASRRPIAEEGIEHIVMDVRDKVSVEQGVKHIAEQAGGIDIVVNNAGMGIGGSLEMATEEEIEVQMGTNFMGCVHVCQAVLPYMREAGRGRIVNISSIGGVMGLPFQGYYSASKFAIEGFSEALSAEVKGFGIDITLIEPGDFATAFTKSRKISQATMEDPSYGPIFKRSLRIIEEEENGGGKAIDVANAVFRAATCRRPPMRKVVANFEQKLSVVLKHILPSRMMVRILRSYYKV